MEPSRSFKTFHKTVPPKKGFTLKTHVDHRLELIKTLKLRLRLRPRSGAQGPQRITRSHMPFYWVKKGTQKPPQENRRCWFLTMLLLVLPERVTANFHAQGPSVPTARATLSFSSHGPSHGKISPGSTGLRQVGKARITGTSENKRPRPYRFDWGPSWAGGPPAGSQAGRQAGEEACKEGTTRLRTGLE